jgi:signal peptidase I
MVDELRHTMPASSPPGELPVDEQKDISQPEEPATPPVKQRAISFFKTLLFTIFIAFFLKLFVVEAFRIPSGSMENTLLVGDFLLVNKLAYGMRTPRYVPFTNLAIPSFTLPLFRSVRRGDVVVFEFPGTHSGELPSGPEYYVKRCIGLPGDTINIRSGYVMVNGREVLLPSHAKSSVIAGTVQSEMVEMGQSSHLSIDGNNFGPTIVPKKGDIIRVTSSSLAAWKKFIEREHHTIELSSSGSIAIDGVETSHYVVAQDYFFVLGDNRGNSLDSRFWGFVPEDHMLGEALVLYWSWNPEQSGDEARSQPASIRWNRIGTLIR